ncbi:hypothetical protein ACLOJK_006714 [Asimina triloba]
MGRITCPRSCAAGHDFRIGLLTNGVLDEGPCSMKDVLVRIVATNGLLSVVPLPDLEDCHGLWPDGDEVGRSCPVLIGRMMLGRKNGGRLPYWVRMNDTRQIWVWNFCPDALLSCPSVGDGSARLDRGLLMLHQWILTCCRWTRFGAGAGQRSDPKSGGPPTGGHVLSLLAIGGGQLGSRRRRRPPSVSLLPVGSKWRAAGDGSSMAAGVADLGKMEHRISVLRQCAYNHAHAMY